MDKERAKEQILRFLKESNVALPTVALYRNLRYRQAPFSDGSLQNYLNELREEGYVERIDAEEFAKGKLVISDDDPGYWVITAEGIQRIEEINKFTQSDIDDTHLR